MNSFSIPIFLTEIIHWLKIASCKNIGSTPFLPPVSVARRLKFGPGSNCEGMQRINIFVKHRMAQSPIIYLRHVLQMVTRGWPPWKHRFLFGCWLIVLMTKNCIERDRHHSKSSEILEGKLERQRLRYQWAYNHYFDYALLRAGQLEGESERERAR